MDNIVVTVLVMLSSKLYYYLHSDDLTLQTVISVLITVDETSTTEVCRKFKAGPGSIY